jgi:hypothetical protein
MGGKSIESTPKGRRSPVRRPKPRAIEIRLSFATVSVSVLLALLLSTAFASGQVLTQIRDTGRRDNRINIVILSEGYTSGELNTKFPTDAQAKMNGFLTAEPYKEYAPYINVFTIAVASAQSGSDHPSRNEFRDTYFNSSYDSFGQERLTTIPPNDRDSNFDNGLGKVYALLAQFVPDYDQVLMVVNDKDYGGSGGPVSIASVNEAATEILIHEIGHTFADLADEYETNDADYSPVERPNATQQTTREQIKWNVWISPGTPIPTPEDIDPSTGQPVYGAVIGLFEGANYRLTGWYRPKHECKMRVLGVPFCSVCAEALVLNIYQRLTLSDSASPDPSRPVVISPLQTKAFSVAALKPATHALSVQWFIDNTPVQGATGEVYNLSGPGLAAGRHTLRVDLRDPTTFVRSDHDNRLAQSISWTVSTAEYTTTDLGPYRIYSINDAGQMVGEAYNQSSGHSHATLFSADGARIDLGSLGDGSAAFAINNTEQIVGSSQALYNGTLHPVHFASAPTSLGTLGDPQRGEGGIAFATSDSGQIVGTSQGLPVVFHLNASPTLLGPKPTLSPGQSGPYGSAKAINDAGQIVGWYQPNAENSRWGYQPHAALFDGNNMPIDLQAFMPEAEYYNTVSVALGINKSGQIVGYSSYGNHGATIFKVGEAPFYLGLGENSAACSINDHGQIVGTFRTAAPSGIAHGFLYTAEGGLADINNLVVRGSAFFDITIGFNPFGDYSSGFVVQSDFYSGRLINNWGQIIALSNSGRNHWRSLLLNPVRSTSTVVDGTQDTRVAYRTEYAAPAFTNDVTGSFGTSVNMRDGTAGSSGTQGPYGLNRRVTETFTANPSTIPLASDVINVEGTADDVVAIQLTYNESAANTVFGTEANARLSWFDGTRWVNSVEGSSAGTTSFAGDRPYNAAKDFRLGRHGIDTAENTVWAVINHGGLFGVGLDSAAPIPSPSGLVGNVATRLPVGTGDNALIQGFIVQGPAGSTKKIMVRAIGPSLAGFGIADALANPTVEIRDANNVVVATNNDWKTTQIGGIITGDQSGKISGSNLAPSDDLESAIVANLVPGNYTAVVRGVENTTGTGIVDAYDMSAGSPARLANIATRGFIQPGDKLMIAGFIIQNASVKAAIRAIGPSLTQFGITNALPDTTLELRNQDGVILLENDNWKTDPAQKQELESNGLQPSHDLEAALITTIPPGQYTAQVRGKDEASGIGVVEVYFLQ